VITIFKENAWKIENVNWGFSSEDISLKFDQKIILPGIFSF